MFEPTATLTLQTTHPSFIPNLRIRSKPAADWVTECFRNRPPHAHTVRAPFAPMRTVATIGSIMQTYQPTISNHAVGEFSHLDDKSTISFVISLGNDGMVRRFVLKLTAPLLDQPLDAHLVPSQDAKKLQANLDAARAKNAAKQPKKKKAGQEVWGGTEFHRNCIISKP